jgi:hypothetical protein
MALALWRAIPRTFTKPSNPAYIQSAAASTSLPRRCPTPGPAPDLGPRWLSDLKNRIGYCISFGLSPAQVEEAGRMLGEIADGWRELVAGSEGFLTGVERRGLFKHEVVWGDMVGYFVPSTHCLFAASVGSHFLSFSIEIFDRCKPGKPSRGNVQFPRFFVSSIS